MGGPHISAAGYILETRAPICHSRALSTLYRSKMTAAPLKRVLGILLLVIFCGCSQCAPRKILVFGGNGFLGSGTVERLIATGDHVTIVSRGNWYWDSETRIFPHVTPLYCDRDDPLTACQLLLDVIAKTDKFDAVIDFSGYKAFEVNESCVALHGKVELYVFVSTDNVYDVSDKRHDAPSREIDAVRHKDDDEREIRKRNFSYGDEKLAAEEVLLAQRLGGGFPFVILRLPDVIGPRDTTYRFWIYQLWLRVSAHLPDRPLTVPHFLEHLPMSLVYSDDVSRVIVEILAMGPQIRDQVMNLAYPETVTMATLLRDVAAALDITDKVNIQVQETGKDDHLYFYPSVREGPINVEKAQSLLDWSPTPWKEAIAATVNFYEDAITNKTFATQRDEILQIVGGHMYEDNMEALFDTVESIYKVDLRHFRPPKDEL